MAKHIFVTGGVVSSLGKGITASSIGLLLKNRGLQVTIQKLDPYLNVDPGTMSPFQHGEVFVTSDGTETDLDLGHYERFIDENLSAESNVTAGQIYWSTINKERKGEYLGGTVQVIPHVTNEIKDRILKFASRNDPDIAITEIGGTVGDIESLPFLEAIRQFRKDVGRENVLYVHVSLVPYIETADELKTKPTQHSVKELRSIGIQPDIIVCRSDRPINDNLKRKIALFCDIEQESVIQALNADNIYEVPLLMHDEKFDDIVAKHLNLESKQPELSEWKDFVNKIKSIKDTIRIAIVGKYVQLPDAYLSIIESLNHAGIQHKTKVKIEWIDAEALSKQEAEKRLSEVNGILVPGGFGVRGIEGKIRAVQIARENNIPFLGICLGLQCSVVEFARNVAGMSKANSKEFNTKTPHPVIDLMETQKGVKDKGGTMRLGNYPCKIIKGTTASKCYGAGKVVERHRHRFEVNNEYRDELQKKGLVISGVSPDGNLVEMVELKDHPFFVATQFHPEFRSRPIRPHPLFDGFVGAAIKEAKQTRQQKKHPVKVG